MAIYQLCNPLSVKLPIPACEDVFIDIRVRAGYKSVTKLMCEKSIPLIDLFGILYENNGFAIMQKITIGNLIHLISHVYLSAQKRLIYVCIKHRPRTP